VNDRFDAPTSQPEPKRDRYGRYLLPDPAGGNGSQLAWTRATTFAKSISDTYSLTNWQLRMAVKGVALRDDLYALAAAAPLDDRATLDRVAKDAKEAAAASSGANLGTALHQFTETVDRGDTVRVPQQWAADIAAYQQTMHATGIRPIPDLIERIVVVAQLKVAGTFDRVLTNPAWRLPRIGDVKTGKELSYGWLEIAVQLALYSRATAIWNGVTEKYEPMPAVDQDTALVMHLPAGKGRCTLYEVDIAAGWHIAQLCQQVREQRARKDLARPFTTTPAAADPVLVDIDTATSIQQLNATWLRHQQVWTADHTAAAARKKAALTA
jgi:hypothetical protein